MSALHSICTAITLQSRSFTFGKILPFSPFFTRGFWTESGDSLHSAKPDLWLASAQPITTDENPRKGNRAHRAWA